MNGKAPGVGEGPAKSLVDGVELTERELLKVLERNGVKRFDPQGAKFAPNVNMQVATAKNPARGCVISGLSPSPNAVAMRFLYRFGVIPFLTPAGRGDYARPQFRLIYVVTARSQAAKLLYPQDDVFSIRDIEHFLGFGVEWWFNSTSYGG